MIERAASPLLRTKLSPPPRRPGHIARDALIGRLAGGAPARVTLVSAPAGWGKTTALREWASAAPASGWLSLDEADNDPVRFWSYVVEALRSAGAAVDTAPALIATDRDGMAALINDLHGLDAPIALALDDLHTITSPQVREGLGFLVEHLPDTVRLGLATRVDPPMGLARLRARGELVEIRVDDLRFTHTEAGALLRAAAGDVLDEEAVARLRTRTEGWAAGLYLAGLSLRNRDDTASFVDDFAGDDRLVVDYLAEEVLATLPADRRRFLLDASVLTRLSAPLCDAVTGRDDAAAMLAELEESNLFLVPLDTRRRWYRFHHLFGELLRNELTAGTPERVPDLHRRAAAWLTANGAPDEAIPHLASAGDLAAAADLIAEHWSTYHDRGWVASILDWMRLLPTQTVRADPRLCLANAWAAITLGRQEEVSGWVDAAQTALGTSAPPDLEAKLAMARSLDHLFHGRSAPALADGRRALALETDPSSQWRAIACMTVAMAHFQADDTAPAYAMFTEAAQAGERSAMAIVPLLSFGHMADMDVQAGDIERAAANAARSLALADAEDHAHFPHAACAHTAAAQVAAARGRPDEAIAEAHRAVALATRGRAGIEIAHTLLVRADIRAAAGDRAGARADVELARTHMTAPGSTVPARLGGHLERLDERLRAHAAAPSSGEELTGRELVVLRLLAGPASLREIAGELVVSPNTVKSQVRAIYRKLGVDGRSRAVTAARERGLLSR